jgi:hypothetical protein
MRTPDSKTTQIIRSLLVELLERGSLFNDEIVGIFKKKGYTAACTLFAIETMKRIGWIQWTGCRWAISDKGKNEIEEGFPISSLPPSPERDLIWNAHWPKKVTTKVGCLA